MVRKLLLSLALLLFPSLAQAACVSPLAGLDATSTSRTFLTVLDGSSNCIGTFVLVDGTAGANKQAVKAGSTAAVATDPAAVVAISPNNTVAVTQSGTWNVGTLTTLTTITNPVAATQSGTWTVQPGNTANTTPWLFTLNQGGGSATTAPTAYGTAPGAGNVIAVNAFVTNANANGANTAANSSPTTIAIDQTNSTTGNIAANNITAVVVNAAPTTLYSIQLGGIGSAPAYLKLYNATSQTCATGTPVKRLIIPAAATAANGAGSNIVFPLGLRFSTGLTYCITTGITDADNTAPAANTFLVNLDWR